MKHMIPRYGVQFYCIGTQCPATCAAPVDMTWTQTLGNFCETGLSLACPKAAELILLSKEPLAFQQSQLDLPSAPLEGLTQAQLELMLDARKTMDIILQNRSLPLRTDLVLALIYGAEFDPMIATDARYAYEELDWGFTEQPYRQIQAVVQLQGSWELKRSDLCNLLGQFYHLCQGDAMLREHLERAHGLFATLSGEDYRQLRERFDGAMEGREALFENLLVYLVHRYFLMDCAHQTVLPGVWLMAVSFAVLRALSVHIWLDAGTVTDEVFVALCWHYARCLEDSDTLAALIHQFETDPLYNRDRLQRLLWN